MKTAQTAQLRRADHFRVIAIFSGLLVLTACIAHQGGILAWEVRIFDALYNLPGWLQPIMVIITQAGSSWMVAILATVFLYFKRLSIAFQVVSVGISTYVLTELAKQIVARPRPFLILSNVHSREPLVTGMGFPSGHTAVTTAIALLLYRFLPRNKRWVVIPWIVLVAVSRVYLGVHAPLDIIGGFSLGVIVVHSYFLVWPLVAKRFRKIV